MRSERRAVETLAAHLREAERDGAGRGGRGYPADVRLAVSEHVTRRRAAGATWTSMAAELGVSAVTVASWARPAARSSLHEATIVADPDVRSESRIVLVAAAGVRVEGLSVPEVIAVLRGLR